MKKIKIGIIGAMNQEIAFFKKIIKPCVPEKIGDCQIYQGKYNILDIILITSGIGKVSASMATMILINLYKPQLILNCGSAGSLNKKLKIGDIIIPNKICYYDVNLTDFGYEIGQIPHNPKYFTIDKKLYQLSNKIAIQYKYNVFNGLLVTGDSFITHSISIQKIKKHFYSAIAVEMEAAAITQVCYKFNIPIIIIKIISDLSNRHATKNFKHNIANVSLNLFYLIKIILKKYMYI